MEMCGFNYKMELPVVEGVMAAGFGGRRGVAGDDSFAPGTGEEFRGKRFIVILKYCLHK